jgi:hypothetical protein
VTRLLECFFESREVQEMHPLVVNGYQVLFGGLASTLTTLPFQSAEPEDRT